MATEDDIIGPVPSIYVDRRIEIGKSIVISGVITPRGNYSGVIPVRIKINDGTTDSYISLNTDSQGYYSTEYTFQTIGVYTITAMVGSEVSNSKTIYCYSHYTSLTLSSDKNIIMAGERATITATLEDNGVPVSGKTVYFEVRKVSDDSLVESLSDVTDSAGVATVSYLGQGAGDIYIEADCMILSETYSIEDCIFVIPFNGNESKKQISGTTTIANGEMSGGSAYLTDSRYLMNLQDNWVLTCDVKFSNANCDVQLVKQGVTSRDSNKVDVQYRQVFNVPSAKWYYYSQNCSYNVYYPVVWKNENGVLTITINGNTITIDSTTWTLAGTDSNMGIGVDNWGGTSYVKNVKLKPL